MLLFTDTTKDKYAKYYFNIINRAKARTLPEGTYTEKHHIIPECCYLNRKRKGPPGHLLGNPDDPANLVVLTAKEHFICHLLLSKIVLDTKYKALMVFALKGMQRSNQQQDRYIINAHTYAYLRTEFAKAISKQNKGRIQPPEEKAKQKAAMVGRIWPKFSNERKANLSASSTGENNGMYGKKHNDSAKAKMSAKKIGHVQSAETIAKKVAKSLGTKRDKKLCPHCHKEIAVNGYARYHGDKCKFARR